MRKINKNSLIIGKIQAARSVKEIMEILKPVEDSIHAIDEAAETLLKSTSSMTTVKHTISLSASEVELSQIKKSGTKPSSKTKFPMARTVLDNYETPDLSQLTRDNESLDELAQSIAELDIAEQTIQGQNLSNMASRDAAIKTIRKLKEEAKSALSKQLIAMSKIAKKTKPKAHLAISNALTEHIKSVIDKKNYIGLSTKTFIYHPHKGVTGSGPVDKETIHYQTYIFIEQFMNDDEEVYESYAFVLTGILDINTGELHHALTSIKEQRIPGSFNIGKEVETSAELKRRVTTLLNLDNFMSRGARRTIPKGTHYLKKPMLATQSNIDGMRVQDDQIYLRLVKGLTDQEEKETIIAAIGFARSVFRNTINPAKNSVVTKRMKGRAEGRIWYRIHFTPKDNADPTEITSNKLKELQSALGLTTTQVQIIKQAIK